MIIKNDENLTWINVKHDIELKIIKGEYAAGERIPSVKKIAEIYNVGTTTAAKTLAQLHTDEILYQKRGIGYFVKPFVKEKLIAKHKKELENMIISACEYSIVLNVDILNIIQNIIFTKTS